VLAYLNSVSLQKKSTEFDIPFDRQQLADYLNLERTALSKELGKMQREGLIKCRKNHFRLIETGKQVGKWLLICRIRQGLVEV
jgi:CRP-like cAMP-binding protein